MVCDWEWISILEDFEFSFRKYIGEYEIIPEYFFFFFGFLLYYDVIYYREKKKRNDESNPCSRLASIISYYTNTNDEGWG